MVKVNVCAFLYRYSSKIFIISNDYNKDLDYKFEFFL